MGGKRLTTHPLARVDQSITATVYVGIINLTWKASSMRFANYANMDVPEGGFMGDGGGFG